jgi:uncharacterized membrane protein YphA (DoxX/SURF4 family)
MNRSRVLRILAASVLVLFALALVFYVPAKAFVASLGLPPTVVLLFIAIVAIVLVALS